jgi:imidazolonepropionase-like amidohydrolase
MMKHFFLTAAGAAALLLSGVCSQAASVHAIRNVTIVDLRTAALHPAQTVVWSDERIVAVGPASKTALPAGAKVIQGAGRFLMPGLWDMHVHLALWDERPRDPLTEDLMLPLFIANGVTGVRDMGDAISRNDADFSLLPKKRLWDAEARSGRRVGPRLLAAASFPIDGPFDRNEWPTTPEFFGAGTPADARKLVHYLIEARKSDFIKMYSRIPRDSYFALMDEARRMGVIVAGHKPLAVSYVEAADAGQHSFEHAREILLDSFPGAAELQANPVQRNLPPEKLRHILDTHDPRMLQQIFAAMIRNDAYYVPTHLTRQFDWLAASDAPVLKTDPRLQQVDPEALQAWRLDVEQTRRRASGPDDARTYERFFEKGLAVTGQANAAGVKIMAGTDVGDSYCFPGSSLHDELALLVKAGLSPAQALRAATVTPAEYVRRQQEFGAVAPGYFADLLLLEANPLVDIDNSRAIAAVVFNGRAFDKRALERMQQQARRAAKQLQSRALN